MSMEILLAGDKSIGWGARIQVRNRGGHPARVTMVSLQQDGRYQPIWKPAPRRSLAPSRPMTPAPYSST
jgi:hypothetical protein